MPRRIHGYEFGITGAYDKIRMTPQNPLFHEDWRDALRHTIKALGGFEAVGHDLWPAKSRKIAGSWLSDCLNAERPAKLDLEEIETTLRMARERGIHCAMHHLCDRVGYTRTDIAPGRTKHQQLADEYLRHATEMARLADELAALETKR